MNIRSTLAATACALAIGTLAFPANAQTVADEAQCSEAKGSGDQNAIRQFCPVVDWPQTFEPEVEAWIVQQTVPDVVYEGELVVGGVLPESIVLMEVPEFAHYR
jgi:hypothetical protein